MQEVVVEAARFLVSHLDRRVTLADVADHVGYSQFHLARAFERHVGVPPGQFLTAHRLQAAKRLLLTSDERVIDVCYAAGFKSVGTFTTRFTAAVGSTPTQFRRLPDVLATSPPRPVLVPGGALWGGLVTGSVRVSPAGLEALGGAAAVYVGLFTRRAARGSPVAGALLAGPGDFALTGIPPGTYWLLSSALPARADAQAQLVPTRGVLGAFHQPLRVSTGGQVHDCDLYLDVADDWAAPVVVALPALASPKCARSEKTAPSSQP